MTIIDYIKKEHANIKERPKQERWQYFWDYYKWHVIITVLVIALLVQLVVGIVNQKELVFTGALLNCKIAIEDDDFLQGFYDCTGIDSATQEVGFYTNLILKDGNNPNDPDTIQQIMASVAIKELDFIVGQTDSFQVCAYNTSCIFADLRTFLDAETLAKYSDKLYYIDRAVQQQLDAPLGVTPAPIEYPDPTKPENMKDPVPVGIDISDCKNFQSAYYFPNTTLYIGVIANTPRPELTRQFIDYLFS